MKNKLLIIAFFLVSILNAQTTIPLSIANESDYSNGNYIKDTEGKLNPFVGTWLWENNTNTGKLTIRLIKKEMYNYEGYSNHKCDILMGGYKYEENGTVITDRLVFLENNYTNDNGPVIYCEVIKGTQLPKVQFSIRDVAKRKRLLGKLELNSDPNSPLTMGSLTATLKLVPQHGWIDGNLYPELVSIDGNTFPFEIVLTKQ